MNTIDWLVMGGTIFLIVFYGIWKSRGTRDIKGYLLADNSIKWWTIGLSIMATQASAITFLSTPGLGFRTGMKFVQFYFGLPIAMVLIAMIAIPIYRKLNVYTAYEYLESRFDLKTRTLGAILFLLGRSLAAGITIVAPAIILETILGWDVNVLCVIIGGLVMIYTVSGGTKAVSQTQQQQMAIILLGMFVAAVVMVNLLPDSISFWDALALAGASGKLEVITLPETTEFLKAMQVKEAAGESVFWLRVQAFFEDRYNIFSGLIAGTFLALSYFGTDQSQVQRYLGGRSITEIRIGLLFNGIFKVPMQFLILLVGVLLFVFYQFNTPPMFFNERERSLILESEYGMAYQELESTYVYQDSLKKEAWLAWDDAREQLQLAKGPEEIAQVQRLLDQRETLALMLQHSMDSTRDAGIALMKERDQDANTKDHDRIFLTFVLNHLPIGLVGLLMAVIFSAAMSSTAAELNALASTSVIDIYKRIYNSKGSDRHYLRVSRQMTMMWGILAIIFAIIAGQAEDLIEYVNILGSLFYGTILGLFVVAFFFKKIQGTAVFWGAVMAEIVVVLIYFIPIVLSTPEKTYKGVGYLWLNLIGCIAVVLFASIIQRIRESQEG
ncbi:MAG: sodium:solute symporter [Bacteroidota bacterium]